MIKPEILPGDAQGPARPDLDAAFDRFGGDDALGVGLNFINIFGIHFV